MVSLNRTQCSWGSCWENTRRRIFHNGQFFFLSICYKNKSLTSLKCSRAPICFVDAVFWFRMFLNNTHRPVLKANISKIYKWTLCFWWSPKDFWWKSYTETPRKSFAIKSSEGVRGKSQHVFLIKRTCSTPMNQFIFILPFIRMDLFIQSNCIDHHCRSLQSYIKRMMTLGAWK